MRRPLVPFILVAALGAPAAAQAREEASPEPAAPPAAPVAAPAAAAKISLEITNGQPTRKRRYFTRGQVVLLAGQVTPAEAGQRAVIEFIRGGRVVSRKRIAVRRDGGIRYRFKVERGGRLALRARRRGAQGERVLTSRIARLQAGSFRAGAGSRGVKVLLLQRSLKRMGFAVSATGFFDSATARAVTAYRKTNRIGTEGYATLQVYRRAFRNRGAFKPRFPRAGRHVEFDWSRQVLALIDKGRAHHVYHSSSGKPSTPTVFGKFRFYRKEPGTNSHGMVHSNYFIGGYAIHGYASVPNYPASHGCLRVPIPNAQQIDRQIEIGQTIYLYR